MSVCVGKEILCMISGDTHSHTHTHYVRVHEVQGSESGEDDEKKEEEFEEQEKRSPLCHHYRHHRSSSSVSRIFTCDPGICMHYMRTGGKRG